MRESQSNTPPERQRRSLTSEKVMIGSFAVGTGAGVVSPTIGGALYLVGGSILAYKGIRIGVGRIRRRE